MYFFSKPYGRCAATLYTVAPDRKTAYRNIRGRLISENRRGLLIEEDYEWFLEPDTGEGSVEHITELWDRHRKQREAKERAKSETIDRQRRMERAKEEHVCPNCGTDMEYDFCDSCGFDLASGTGRVANWFASFFKSSFRNSVKESQTGAENKS